MNRVEELEAAIEQARDLLGKFRSQGYCFPESVDEAIDILSDQVPFPPDPMWKMYHSPEGSLGSHYEVGLPEHQCKLMDEAINEFIEATKGNYRATKVTIIFQWNNERDTYIRREPLP